MFQNIGNKSGKVVEVLKSIIEGQCQEMSISNLALEIMPDHLYSSKIVDF